MREINKKWRCIMPFDESGNIIKSDLSSNGSPILDEDDAFIYIEKGSSKALNRTTSGGRALIYKINKDTLRLIYFYPQMYKQLLSLFDKNNINIIDEYELEGEGYIDFKYSDCDKVCRLVGAKKQNKTPVGITNVRENYPYFLRTFLHINNSNLLKLDDWYGRSAK
jgi:hypothetical protein